MSSRDCGQNGAKLSLIKITDCPPNVLADCSLRLSSSLSRDKETDGRKTQRWAEGGKVRREMVPNVRARWRDFFPSATNGNIGDKHRDDHREQSDMHVIR